MVLALLSLAFTAAVPDLQGWSVRRQTRAAAARLALEIQGLRAAALADRRGRGLVFRADLSGWDTARDGDGDGVRQSDLSASRDVLVGPGFELAARFPAVAVGLPAKVIPAPGGSRPRSPLPFMPSGILGASAEGRLSTGTVYLCHRTETCAAVRVYGAGARVAVWEYADGVWQRRW